MTERSDLQWFLMWENFQEDFPDRTMDDFADDHGLSHGQMKNKVYRGSKDHAGLSDKVDETLDVSGNKNRKDVFSESDKITNVDELRAATGMSEDEWEIVKGPETKTWNGYIKNSYGEIETVQLWSIAVEFAKINPTPIKPVVPNLRISFKHPRGAEYKPSSRALGSAYSRSLVIADAQVGLFRNMRENTYVPIHDRKALDVVWQVARMGGWDNIILNGDWMDFPEQSTHFTQEPRFSFTTQPGIMESAWWLSRLRAWNTKARIVYLEGNHEERLVRNMLENAPQNYGLRNPFKLNDPAAWSVPSLLGLRDMGIKYIDGYPNNELWLEDDLKIIHGNISRAKTSTLNKIKELNPSNSVIMGHTHRAQELRHSLDTRKGNKGLVYGISGCLCRLDQVIPGHNVGQGWTQGFYEIYHNPAEHHVTYHPIVDGRLIYNGQLLVGDPDLDDMREYAKELGWTL